MVLRQVGSALAAVLAAVAVGLCPTECRATAGLHVVPQPLIVKLDPSGKELVISPTFGFAASCEPSATLTAAVGRFDALVSCTAALDGGRSDTPSAVAAAATISTCSVNVTVTSPDPDLNLDTDESYALAITPEGNPISTCSTWLRWTCSSAFCSVPVAPIST